MFSFRGKKVGPLPDLSPLRVNSKFPTSILTPFIWESLRGGLPRYFIVLAPGSNSTNKFKLSFFSSVQMEGDERLELANLHLFIAGVGSLICLLEYVLSFETVFICSWGENTR